MLDKHIPLPETIPSLLVASLSSPLLPIKLLFSELFKAPFYLLDEMLLIHEPVNKANKIFKIYSVKFCFFNNCLKNNFVFYWDFLGGSVAKTLCSQYRGPKFDLWSGNLSMFGAQVQECLGYIYLRNRLMCAQFVKIVHLFICLSAICISWQIS